MYAYTLYTYPHVHKKVAHPVARDEVVKAKTRARAGFLALPKESREREAYQLQSNQIVMRLYIFLQRKEERWAELLQ